MSKAAIVESVSQSEPFTIEVLYPMNYTALNEWAKREKAGQIVDVLKGLTIGQANYILDIVKRRIEEYALIPDYDADDQAKLSLPRLSLPSPMVRPKSDFDKSDN